MQNAIVKSPAEVFADKVTRVAIARRVGCVKSNVTNHIKAGGYPASWRLVLDQLADESGVERPGADCYVYLSPEAAE